MLPYELDMSGAAPFGVTESELRVSLPRFRVSRVKSLLALASRPVIVTKSIVPVHKN